MSIERSGHVEKMSWKGKQIGKFLVCVYGLQLYFVYENMQDIASNAVGGNSISHEAVRWNVHAG